MALVSNQTELQLALDLGDPLIEIINGFTIESQIMITYPVTIQSQAETLSRELKRRTGYTGVLFSVETGGNLVMLNLILDGDKEKTLATHPILDAVSALTMKNVTVQNNASTTDGGGIRGAGADAAIIMDDCVVQGCDSGKDGGGMFIQDNSPTISRCTFAGNVAEDDGEGGGIAIRNGSPEMIGCTFLNNSSSAGGAVSNIYGGNPILTDCIISNNHAGTGGGVFNNHGILVFNGCVFSNNAARGRGGGVYSDFMNSYFINCSFVKNTAESGGGLFTTTHLELSLLQRCIFTDNKAQFGGGLFTSVGNMSLNGCLFFGNEAQNAGGGLYMHSSEIIMENCSILNNSAKDGGGLGQLGGVSALSGVIRDNRASGNGGGICLESGSETFLATAFVEGDICDNAAVNGGGVYVTSSSTLLLADGAILRNAASGSGGGIYLEAAGSSRLSAPMSMFSNSAGDSGAGIYNGGVLGIFGAMDYRDGVFLPSAEHLIKVEGPIENAFIQLERSPYVSPDRAKAPIDVAVTIPERPALTEADKAAFNMPSGFEDWYFRLNEQKSHIQLDYLTKYTITYENLMCAHHSNPATYDAQTLPIALLPPEPIPCHCFAGWFDTECNRVTEIPAGTEGNITLYAQWRQNCDPC